MHWPTLQTITRDPNPVGISAWPTLQAIKQDLDPMGFLPGQPCRPSHKTLIPWRFQPLLHSPSEVLASGSQEFLSPPSGTSLHSTSDTSLSGPAMLTISCLHTLPQISSSLYLGSYLAGDFFAS